MAKDYYLPNGDEERATWLNNFANKLPHYAGKYSITPEEIMDVQNSALYYDALIKFKNQSSAFQNALTEHKNAMRNGMKVGATLQPLMQPPLMLPMPVQPGIFTRMAAIVSRIKANMTYSESDGNDLGVEGTQISVDFNNVKPIISLRLVKGGHPEIVWTRQGMSALEIQKLGSDGKWYLLAIDTSPNYIDTEPLPAMGQSAVWQYRAIYRLKDERMGSWSDVITITVAG